MAGNEGSANVRPEILMFAHALEKQMRYNEARGKTDEWKEANPRFLFMRLRDEVEELHVELSGSLRVQKNIRHESLDVGSLAFFIWYNSLLRTSEGIAPQDGENR